MTSTRDLLDAALAHWATRLEFLRQQHTTQQFLASHEADYDAFARAVPLIADALEAAGRVVTAHSVYDELHTALAALEAN